MGISKREWVILVALMVVAAGLYIFVLQPTAKERASLAAEAKHLARKSQKIHQALEAIPRGKEGVAEVKSRMEKIRALHLDPSTLVRIRAHGFPDGGGPELATGGRLPRPSPEHL